MDAANRSRGRVVAVRDAGFVSVCLPLWVGAATSFLTPERQVKASPVPACSASFWPPFLCLMHAPASGCAKGLGLRIRVPALSSFDDLHVEHSLRQCQPIGELVDVC